MATRRRSGSRRHAIRTLTALAAGTLAPRSRAAIARPGQASGESAPAPSHPEPAAALAATWQEDGGHYVGVLAPVGGSLVPLSRRRLPSRAHGVAVEPAGSVLVAARRPGDWLFRFDPVTGVLRESSWADGTYAFNGHVVRSRDNRRLFTTETDLDTGFGSVGVRDARTLALLARWPTGGLDPHELVEGPGGSLWVANGGLETRPETGRIKHRPERMDSSLVRLDAGTGKMTGQWRLDDRRLGLRHLAVTGNGTLAVALQAEHDDPEARQTAPVLACWDRRHGLRTVSLPPDIRLAGYGGSIAGAGGFIEVSCPRAGQVARWHLAAGGARWLPPLALPEACATASGWLGGVGWAIRAGAGSGEGREGGEGAASAAGGGSHAAGSDGPPVERWPLADGVRLDNHWTAMPAGAARTAG